MIKETPFVLNLFCGALLWRGLDVWALGCHVGGREFDSRRTNTKGLKRTEEKVLPL